MNVTRTVRWGMLAVVWMAPVWADEPSAASAVDQPVGEMFGVPVPRGNYEFAARVASMFPRPWGGADVSPEQREPLVWEQLLQHFEAYRRGIEPAEEDVERLINELLKHAKQPFTRRSDPEAYERWVVETLSEGVPYFENQIRYLLQIHKLREQIFNEAQVVVTDEEMHRQFLDETHHVGGEMVVFDANADAEAFYRKHRKPAAWAKMKQAGAHDVRSVAMMTLIAYMDLWQVPRAQVYALHAMKIGAVGPPMPFGNQWCVYRLLDKRVGDLKDFPSARDAHAQKLEARKRHAAVGAWVNELKQRAALKTFVTAPRPAGGS